MSLKPLDSLPEKPLKIKRALLSVSNKTDITVLASALHENSVELISTGGTAKNIRDAGLPVTDVSDVTGFPECLDGRVKTLHPAIHGGLLARTSYQPDLDELNKLGIQPFELVVVNLYPFRDVISDGDVNPATATEYIDIGGPSMIRAAGKNFAHVCVLSSPAQYQKFINEFEQSKEISYASRRRFARNAFEHTAEYDSAISNYMAEIEHLNVPDQLSISLPKSGTLRYGENPHQKAALYGSQSHYIDCFHGRELSYNNYLDINSALALMSDLGDQKPAAAIFKHTVPCGVAVDDSLSGAYKKAFSTDRLSPFGGIVIVNQKLDPETAREIDKIFTEIILAPGFDGESLEILTQKKNRRLVRIKQFPSGHNSMQIKSIFGGLLAQEEDRQLFDQTGFKIVTSRKPTNAEKEDLIFAWTIVKHVKSNAIVYAKNQQTLGIGTGQTSRVDSSEIAVQKAVKENLSLENCVIASDAFFPFPDGIETAASAGATAVIQPGGSIRDDQVIETANQNNMTMIFTGMRHFKH